MEAVIQVLELTIAARDSYTVGHQRRVSQVACKTSAGRWGYPRTTSVIFVWPAHFTTLAKSPSRPASSPGQPLPPQQC